MQRRRLNLVLAGVVAALGVATYFSSQKKPPGPPLAKFKADEVDRIVIDHPGKDTIRLERHDKQWMLTAPVKVEADPLEAAGIAGLAEKETREKLDPAQVKLAELKLDPPDYKLTLNDATIAFGGTEPLEYRRYVKTGDGLFLVEDPPGASLDADYADLVAKSVIPERAVITRIEVPGLVLTRDAAGNWSAAPPGPKATPEAMRKVIDGWKNARAMWNELAPKDKPPTGDAVKITVESGATYSFVIAAREPQFKLYRPDAGVNLVLSKALADELLKLPEPTAPAAPAANTPPGTPLAPATPPAATPPASPEKPKE